jgi:hypothetical protein
MRQQLQEKQAEVLLLQQQVRRIISQDMPTELDRCACVAGCEGECRRVNGSLFSWRRYPAKMSFVASSISFISSL